MRDSEKFKWLGMQIDGCIEKIEYLENRIKQVDQENILRIERSQRDIDNKLNQIISGMQVKSIKKSIDETLHKEITDTERLDFMEKNLTCLRFNEVRAKMKELEEQTWYLYNHDFSKPGYPIGLEYYGITLREAIDAAIRNKDGN